MSYEGEWALRRQVEVLKEELAEAKRRVWPQGWANDPEIAPLKYELQRLRTELEAKSRELSNARIERDAARAQLRGTGRDV